ncbi:carboxymuconolactone decarboxylase family protein [Streptacidiphilus neutrinimicus]|uniref:carboxymuconolactone decarboxylase family protein n=1 Tax=Streptacidiphilus neutrinimicus TaxID=105420 RepID=UPI0005A6F640|nr:carboxymuconolactone decarboxylase family protein [Streptacidiphilus neutrinimicus]
MARISLTPPRTIVYRIAEWYSKRVYGDVLDPGKVYGHNTRVLLAYAGFERKVAKWRALDPQLKELAVMAAAARIGCSWCMDFGYWEAHKLGLPQEKLRAVPVWRERREVFTPLELSVLEYAEAMTETEPTVTDEMAAALLKLLGEAAFVELTAMVAVENLRSRVNSAVGLVGQGFKDRCAVPSKA